MRTLEQLYLDKASECEAKGDSFGAAYWRKQAYLVGCE